MDPLLTIEHNLSKAEAGIWDKNGIQETRTTIVDLLIHKDNQLNKAHDLLRNIFVKLSNEDPTIEILGLIKEYFDQNLKR